MLRGIKVRLYPNNKQRSYINRLLGSYRFVYNNCLEQKINAYTEDKTNLGLKGLSNYFHHGLVINKEYSWLKEHNTKVLKQSIIDLLYAYKNFFNRNEAGFPKFKSKNNNRQSCRFSIETISRKNDYNSNHLTLTNQIKNIKFRTSDKYRNYLVRNKENIRSATLSKTKSGKYFLSILVDGDMMKEKVKPSNDFVGIDLGIKTFIVTSKGDTFENIKITRNNEKKLAKLHRNISRKKNGSRNKEKSRIKLARFNEKLDNIKDNYLHNVTNQLINKNQVISVENLSIRGMMKNHYLAKSIQELSLFRFKAMLLYKAKWNGNYIIQVDRYFPSSKLCSDCGYKNDKLELSDREWTCPNCGTKHNRDKNAAINLENEGRKLYKEKIGHRLSESKPVENKSTKQEVNNNVSDII